MVENHSLAEEMYDRYDDSGVYDAATIRAMTGFEGDGSNEDFSAEAIRARNPDLDFTAVPAKYKHGFNRRGWEAASETPEGKRRIDDAIAAGRLAMHPPREHDVS